MQNLWVTFCKLPQKGWKNNDVARNKLFMDLFNYLPVLALESNLKAVMSGFWSSHFILFRRHINVIFSDIEYLSKKTHTHRKDKHMNKRSD